MAMADKEQSLKNKSDFSETDIIRKQISFYEMVLHDRNYFGILEKKIRR